MNKVSMPRRVRDSLAAARKQDT